MEFDDAYPSPFIDTRARSITIDILLLLLFKDAYYYTNSILLRIPLLIW